jgi:hypothetical protein
MFSKSIETLLDSTCPEAYVIFRIIRKEFPDSIPIKLPLASLNGEGRVRVYKHIQFNTKLVKRKIKIDEDTFKPTLIGLKRKLKTVPETNYLKVNETVKLTSFLIKYLRLNKSGLKDNEIRDYSQKIMHKILKNSAKMVICETPEDHIALYEVHALSCMSPKSTSYNTWLRNYLYKEHNLWPSMWYSHCPYTQGVYLKVANRGVARAILIRKNPTHKFKKYYGIIYAESGFYRSLFLAILKNKGFTASCYDNRPNINSVFKVPAIQILEKPICPLPYHDCLSRGYYCHFNKKENMFYFGPKKLLPKSAKLLGSSYYYRGYFDSDMQPAHETLTRR